MMLKSLFHKVKLIFSYHHNIKTRKWERVNVVPKWAWKRLNPRSLAPLEYRIVKGKHYLYKAWRGDVPPQQGPVGIILYRKKRKR